jgi:septation ring formation regulator EzrA
MIILVEYELFEAKEIFNEIRFDLTQDEIAEIEVTIQILSDTIKSSKNGSEFDNVCKTKPEIKQSKQRFEEISPSIVKIGEKGKLLAYHLSFLMTGTAGWFWNED